MQPSREHEIEVSLGQLLADLETFSVTLPERVVTLQRLRDHLKKVMGTLGAPQKFRFKGILPKKQKDDGPPPPESVVDVLASEIAFIQKSRERFCEEIRNKIMPDIESLSLSFLDDGNSIVKDYRKLVRDFSSEASSKAVTKAHSEMLLQYRKSREPGVERRKRKMSEEERAEGERKRGEQLLAAKQAFLGVYQKSDGPRVTLATKLISLSSDAAMLTDKCFSTIQLSVEKYAALLREYGLGILDCSQAITLGLGRVRLGDHSVIERPKTTEEMAEDRAAASVAAQEARKIGAVEVVPSGGLTRSPERLAKDELWETYDDHPEFSGEVKEMLVIMKNFEQLNVA